MSCRPWVSPPSSDAVDGICCGQMMPGVTSLIYARLPLLSPLRRCPEGLRLPALQARKP